MPDSPFVTYAPEALPVHPWTDGVEEDEGGFSFCLSGPDLDAVAAAVDTAADQFSYVADDGTILTQQQVEDGVPRSPDVDPWDELYTPNWVGGVALEDHRAHLTLDTKGMVPGPMVRTMVALIVEELSRGAVQARFEKPPRWDPV